MSNRPSLQRKIHIEGNEKETQIVESRKTKTQGKLNLQARMDNKHNQLKKSAKPEVEHS
jgi:hypothetical protein